MRRRSRFAVGVGGFSWPRPFNSRSREFRLLFTGVQTYDRLSPNSCRRAPHLSAIVIQTRFDATETVGAAS